jgi:hypothetical protein
MFRRSLMQAVAKLSRRSTVAFLCVTTLLGGCSSVDNAVRASVAVTSVPAGIKIFDLAWGRGDRIYYLRRNIANSDSSSKSELWSVDLSGHGQVVSLSATNGCLFDELLDLSNLDDQRAGGRTICAEDGRAKFLTFESSTVSEVVSIPQEGTAIWGEYPRTGWMQFCRSGCVWIAPFDRDHTRPFPSYDDHRLLPKPPIGAKPSIHAARDKSCCQPRFTMTACSSSAIMLVTASNGTC